MSKFLCFLGLFLLQTSNSWTPDKSDLLGKLDPSSDESFSLIADEYTNKSNIYMRSVAYEAFKDMYWDAHKCGIHLQIVSATRNFDYQKGIWERKWKRDRYAGWKDVDKVKDILKYSSMPGTSRHHWGTDIDFNALTNDYFESGAGLKVYNWLSSHAADYGFHQTYTSKEDGRTGYEEEKWHWSYFPLSEQFLEEYEKQVTYEDITGFSGSSYAEEVKAIEHYVMGIEHPAHSEE